MEGVLCQMDDFIGFRRTTEEHYKRMKQALKQIEVMAILNQYKVHLDSPRSSFWGTSLPRMAYQQTQIKRGHYLK